VTASTLVLRVAVPSPLDRYFDYLPIPGVPLPIPGTRVRVPFGRRDVVGVVLGSADSSDVPPMKLKRIRASLDPEPVLSGVLLELLTWVSAYYHHPIGEVLGAALPAVMRRGQSPVTGIVRYRPSERAMEFPNDRLKRAPAQRRLLELLIANPTGLTADGIVARIPDWRSPVKRLQERGLVEVTTSPPEYRQPREAEPGPPMTDAQSRAVAAIHSASGFECFLIHGVTGSGKTEVYLAAMSNVLAAGKQVLVLVPEIGLTPQFVRRLERRLGCAVAVSHSGLGDRARFEAWDAARHATAPVLIGTRSAVYTPLPKLGLIVVDEEHDPSFKQQDGFRYHARDVAIKRASLESVPVVLGSATPSLESYQHAVEGRYRLLTLPERTGVAQPPQVSVIDMRQVKANEGLSPQLIDALHERLRRQEQSLLFLNRRGFAPVLMCHDCGWIAPCQRCDAHLTVHRRAHKMICHHCGAEAGLPESCPICASRAIHGIGEGTERIEATLVRLFPAARIERIDRDSTRRKGSLEQKLERVAGGDVDILIGTQMLAKGHDFPNLTLVGVLNADQGLYSSDFRGEERLVQQLVQVSGRAGRAAKSGQVLVQTWHPGHPAFASLVEHDYRTFARVAIDDRRSVGFPPFAHLVLWRAESVKPGLALDFLRHVHELMDPLARQSGATLYDPVPSPMERRAGRYRAQLLLLATDRRRLHGMLAGVLGRLRDEKQSRTVRWSVDIDPQEMF